MYCFKELCIPFWTRGFISTKRPKAVVMKLKVGGCDFANIAIANIANKQSTTLLENANFKLP